MMRISMTKQAIEIWRKVRSACMHMHCVRVTVTFDGSGDSGQVEDIVFSSATGTMETPPIRLGECEVEAGSYYHDGKWSIATESRDMSLVDAVETVAYDVLSESYGGWENNAGAYGEIVFDIPSSMIKCQFNERIEESEYSESVFDDAPEEA